jgi:hypothetical protein
MSKSQRSNREAKKQAQLTPKEKKAAKRAKKHAGDSVPLIVKGSLTQAMTGGPDGASGR